MGTIHSPDGDGKEFGKDAMEKFLKYELDGYLSGRSTERINEQAIARNDGQGYIHHQKEVW